MQYIVQICIPPICSGVQHNVAVVEWMPILLSLFGFVAEKTVQTFVRDELTAEEISNVQDKIKIET